MTTTDERRAFLESTLPKMAETHSLIAEQLAVIRVLCDDDSIIAQTDIDWTSRLAADLERVAVRIHARKHGGAVEQFWSVGWIGPDDHWRPITTVVAHTVPEAEAEARRTLSKPGREDILNWWVRNGCRVRAKGYDMGD